jgi:hypothetical protein
VKIPLLSLLLALIFAIPVWARLGETEDQLVSRYGKETGMRSAGQAPFTVTILLFQKSGFDIEVTLLNGVSVQEWIKKSSGDKITNDEAGTLLRINNQGHFWSPLPSSVQWEQWSRQGAISPLAGFHPNQIWERDDDAMAALGVWGDYQGFMVKSKKLIDFEQAAYKAVHSTSLEGF